MKVNNEHIFIEEDGCISLFKIGMFCNLNFTYIQSLTAFKEVTFCP